ncbi:unnamed protein product [Nyctereutes procyonoides]|uniref:(raccoon dog) hypothetical protein n=1 Tax=Nyctereutes procyonoides TaxID=34880 RepID=A0A811ZJK7_NYCPR|nr:unnamed protein product [Nyctereutes procyonoides]
MEPPMLREKRVIFWQDRALALGQQRVEFQALLEQGREETSRLSGKDGMKRGKELEGHTERREVRGHTQRSISSPNTHPGSVLGSGLPRSSADSQYWSFSPLSQARGQCRACIFRSRAGRQGFSSQPGSEPLFVQVWAGGGGLPAASPRLALDFLTKEAGGSPRGFPLPGENSLLPYIHAYISGTDKSSLFGNKPRRPAGSPWPSRTRTASGWERTLTTQNSFTNGLVLSFFSRGPQISLPESSAHSDLAGSTVPQEAGGRLLRRRAGRRSRDPKGRGPPSSQRGRGKKTNVVTAPWIWGVSARP